VSRARFAIMLVGGATAGLAAWNISRRQAASAGVAPTLQRSPEGLSEVVELRRGLAEVRREMRVMRAGQPSLEAPAEHVHAPVVPAGEQAKPPRQEERAARDSARNEQTGLVIASRLKTEPRDPAWSALTERQVAEALSTTPIGGTQLVSAECRTTMCAVTLKHDDIDAQRRASFQIQRHVPFFSQAFYTYAMNDDVPTMTVYFAREGRQLPQPQFDE
jgi:hypothetical protein